MNITDLYLYRHEIDVGTHVKMIEDAYFEQDGMRIFIPRGEKGKIIKKNNYFFDIYFESDTFLKQIPMDKVEILNEINGDQALEIVESYIGHHSKSNDQLYQFNIKMYGYRIPEKAFDYFGDMVYEVLASMESDLFDSFTEGDCAPLSFFEWIEHFYTAGRTSGYLMLKDKYRSVSNYIDSKYLYDEEDLLFYLDDPESANEVIEYYIQEQKYIIELAYDLQMIEKLIRLYQNKLYELVNSDDFWEMKIESFKEAAQH